MIRQDNHYVPGTYLKRWASSASRRVWVYRLLVSHENVPAWKQNSPSAIAYHTHLYTRAAAGGESDEMEVWLDREFESPGALAIEKAASDGRLTNDDWVSLIRFLAAQDVRTPARMIEMLHQWKEQMPPLVDDTLSNAVAEIKKAHHEGRRIVSETRPNTHYFPSRVTVEQKPGEDNAALRVETSVGRALWL